MPGYKLHYFNLRGLGEVPRLVLAQAGVEFEDVRVPFDKWPEVKTKMPFGQMPVLEVDGKFLAQSATIARYLARQHGLAGKDDWESARVDMYADCIKDLLNARPKIFGEEEAKVKELLTEYVNTKVKDHLETLEKHLESSASGFLVGDSVTWADLGYFEFLSFLSDKVGKDFLEKHPKVHALVDKVGNLPNIKKWVESRPQTAL